MHTSRQVLLIHFCINILFNYKNLYNESLYENFIHLNCQQREH